MTVPAPAYLSVPEYVATAGNAVGDLCRLANFGPDIPQQLALDVIFARNAAGTSAAFEIAAIVARQNMKTGLFKQATLGWAFLFDVPLIVWSAHLFDTAQEAFHDLDELIAGSDYLRKRVRRVNRSHGDEGFELLSGARIQFKARTKAGGRGLSGGKVILDEAFALRPDHMGSLIPLLSAQPDPQVLYGSSAGMADSKVLRGVRDRGRKGSDPRLGYIEYCAPDPSDACELGDKCDHALDRPGCGCDKPELWHVANPALDVRIQRSTIAAERRALPPEEFARERMGWWDDPADENADEILAPFRAAWPDRGDADSTPTGAVALGLDVTPDGSTAAVAVYGQRGDELGHGELIAPDPARGERGTGWVVKRLVELRDEWQPCALVIDPGGPAGRFVRALQANGFVSDRDPQEGETRLVLMGAREYAQACAALVDDVVNDRMRHIGQEQLADAVDGARRRNLLDAWAWSRRDSSVDISPLVALTLARDGFAAYGEESEVDAWVLTG